MSYSTASAVPLTVKTQVRWKIFLAILFLMAVNYIDRASLSVAMPIIGKEFSLTPSEQGLLLSSFFWTYALMQLPSGMLTDRFKPRLMIAASTMLWGFFQAIAAGSTSFVTLLITRLGLGAAEAPLYPAGAKLNAMWLTNTERGRGATLLDGGAPLGAALGSLIIAWLIGSLGSWRMSFVIAGVGTIIAGAWCWYYIRNTPREHPHVNSAEADYIEAEHQAEDRLAAPMEGGKVINFFRHRSIWGMCLGWMGFSVMFTGFIAWLPSYLLASYGFNIKTMGSASFLIYMSGFVGEMVAGWVSDQWKARGATTNKVYRTMFGIAAVIATLSIFAVAYVSDPIIAVVLLCVALFFLRWFGLFWSLPAILGGRERAGFVGGTMNLSGQIAGIGVPIIIGVIVQASGGSYFGALMFMASAGVAMFIAAMMIDYSKKVAI